MACANKSHCSPSLELHGSFAVPSLRDGFPDSSPVVSSVTLVVLLLGGVFACHANTAVWPLPSSKVDVDLGSVNDNSISFGSNSEDTDPSGSSAGMDMVKSSPAAASAVVHHTRSRLPPDIVGVDI